MNPSHNSRVARPVEELNIPVAGMDVDRDQVEGQNGPKLRRQNAVLSERDLRIKLGF